ncbi:thioredoxin [Lachnospiraceae bacterium OttesenSCG-928-E19]|nr:thioredoxin [Lachnospiraceae bacterium OttesenSCG-928-E19]
MSIIHITADNFEQEVLKETKPVVIDFWATWCMPCKQFGPIFEKVAEDYADRIKFVKIDVDESKELAMKYRVMSIPTIAILKDGAVVKRESGVKDESQFKAWIESAV